MSDMVQIGGTCIPLHGLTYRRRHGLVMAEAWSVLNVESKSMPSTSRRRLEAEVLRVLGFVDAEAEKSANSVRVPRLGKS